MNNIWRNWISIENKKWCFASFFYGFLFRKSTRFAVDLKHQCYQLADLNEKCLRDDRDGEQDGMDPFWANKIKWSLKIILYVRVLNLFCREHTDHYIVLQFQKPKSTSTTTQNGKKPTNPTRSGLDRAILFSLSRFRHLQFARFSSMFEDP